VSAENKILSQIFSISNFCGNKFWKNWQQILSRNHQVVFFSMKNVGLIFGPMVCFWAGLFFFFGWKVRENENFGEKITTR
jgi:hypothetical protein